METMARVVINSCPQVSAVVSADLYPTGEVQCWHVSVVCTETSGACYDADPASSFRSLEGTFQESFSKNECPLPEVIQARINDMLNQGAYNMRSCYGYISAACIRYFRPGLGQLHRNEEKVKRIRRLAEEAMRKNSYQIDWYEIAATLGLKVE